MNFGDQIVALAKTHIGERYKWGARARYLDPNYKGPWDCAEFVSWIVFQTSEERELLGCVPRDPAKADANTGYWADDANKYRLTISIDEAIKTAGAALLRTRTQRSAGHIAICVGDGLHTIEAHSSKDGVIQGRTDPVNRGWEFGVRIPDPNDWTSLTKRASDPKRWYFRPTASTARDPRVEVIQQAIETKGLRVPRLDGRFTSNFSRTVAKYQERSGLVVDGMVGKQTQKALDIDWASKVAPSGIFNDKYGVFFDSLVPGGFFSHDPDDLRVKRSIRTNNPGALNFSGWQKGVPGYVSVTPPDNSRNRNRTTIYRTPEHGVAAWFVLLSKRYGFGDSGRFTLEQLARKYAGSGASSSDVNAYIKGWSKASGDTLNANSVFKLSETAQMLSLGKAMFHHEIGRPSPLEDDQIRFGIDKQPDDEMPA
jgi:peptidoglycan hydrolase-like protein with peptidoglycan-binding domain